jgi:hypothetical protein
MRPGILIDRCELQVHKRLWDRGGVVVGNGAFCFVVREGLGWLRFNRLVDWESESCFSNLILYECECKDKGER